MAPDVPESLALEAAQGLRRVAADGEGPQNAKIENHGRPLRKVTLNWLVGSCRPWPVLNTQRRAKLVLEQWVEGLEDGVVLHQSLPPLLNWRHCSGVLPRQVCEEEGSRLVCGCEVKAGRLYSNPGPKSRVRPFEVANGLKERLSMEQQLV